jgi:hypothetical protein
MQHAKVQFNVYVQRRRKDYIEEVVSTEGSSVESNSDAVNILFAYAEKFWTQDDWNKLAQQMKVYGDEGLVKV